MHLRAPGPGHAHCDPDLGGIVTGWLTRIVVIGAVVGLVGFDGLSLVTTRLDIIDEGKQAARAGSSTWRATPDVQAAYDAAARDAAESNALNVVHTDSFTVARDDTVSLRIDREATTLLLHRIKPLRQWTVVREDVSGRSVE
jgi:hypothetical protein